MTNIYIKQNGKKVIINVTEDVSNSLKHLRRSEWRNEAKEKYHNISLNSIEAEREIFSSLEPSILDLLIKNEEDEKYLSRVKIMKKAVELLTIEQQKLILKHYKENRTFKEIAEEFNSTEDAIKKRWKRIKKHLENIFKKLSK